ncbi:hypothetical protein SFUMM280S_01003 [Streptomyces fumanus]
MIGGRALDRVVAVLAEGQGSGVLLDRRYVLTAWHVVESGAVEAIHPSARSTTPCKVIWENKALDVALLRADAPLVSAERAAPMGLLRTGRVDTPEPLPHCQIVGFPEIQRYGDENALEYDQYRVSVLPMAGRMRRTLVCELDRPPADEAGRRAALQGLSGAPVFAGRPVGHRHRDPARSAALQGGGGPVRGGGAGHGRREPRPHPKPKVEDVTDVHPQDERFEARYAEDLGSQYRKTEIFGIDELGRGEARWDLDTSYLSLEAEPSHKDNVHRSRRPKSASSSHRIDTLLADRPRALLRGEAGAGKTTLVWWLAAHAANATLNENLAELNGLVPFVIPLREVHARGGKFPAPPDLLSAGRVLTDSPPAGWVRRVLEAGRGLLLVDGLDEVPESRREEARRWLAVLLDRYPRTRCLATVRPNAVEKDWLAPDGFTELTLRPMSDEDIRAFVEAWHAAARIECDHLFTGGRRTDERDQLTSLKEPAPPVRRERRAAGTRPHPAPLRGDLRPAPPSRRSAAHHPLVAVPGRPRHAPRRPGRRPGRPQPRRPDPRLRRAARAAATAGHLAGPHRPAGKCPTPPPSSNWNWPCGTCRRSAPRPLPRGSCGSCWSAAACSGSTRTTRSSSSTAPSRSSSPRRSSTRAATSSNCSTGPTRRSGRT